MALRNQPPTWQAIGESVEGARHRRAGQSNQDRIAWLPNNGPGPRLILALSDGHGGSKSFRSQIGAEFAVEAAKESLQDILSESFDPTKLSELKHSSEDRLSQSLVRRWRRRVEDHLAVTPISPEELGFLEQSEGTTARRAVESNMHLAYGATLLACAATESFLLFLQLGDGDILTVSAAGEVARPLPADRRLLANETTSLCTKDAWKDTRLVFQAITDRQPALILLSTDGYANSFRNEEGFRRVGSDMLEMIRADGIERVKSQLRGWLEEASETGSGDDVTLGALIRLDALPGEDFGRLSTDGAK